jgi:hypothetical protein
LLFLSLEFGLDLSIGVDTKLRLLRTKYLCGIVFNDVEKSSGKIGFSLRFPSDATYKNHLLDLYMNETNPWRTKDTYVTQTNLGPTGLKSWNTDNDYFRKGHAQNLAEKKTSLCF